MNLMMQRPQGRAVELLPVASTELLATMHAALTAAHVAVKAASKALHARASSEVDYLIGDADEQLTTLLYRTAGIQYDEAHGAAR